MLLTIVGVLLIICGVVVAALGVIRRGRLSQTRESGTGAPRDTLEPTGRGNRLGLKADMPGIVLFALGALLIFLGGLAK